MGVMMRVVVGVQGDVSSGGGSEGDGRTIDR